METKGIGSKGSDGKYYFSRTISRCFLKVPVLLGFCIKMRSRVVSTAT